jgi:hypothetical protein
MGMERKEGKGQGRMQLARCLASFLLLGKVAPVSRGSRVDFWEFSIKDGVFLLLFMDFILCY